jgi:hypothetical protein
VSDDTETSSSSSSSSSASYSESDSRIGTEAYLSYDRTSDFGPDFGPDFEYEPPPPAATSSFCVVPSPEVFSFARSFLIYFSVWSSEALYFTVGFLTLGLGGALIYLTAFLLLLGL